MKKILLVESSPRGSDSYSHQAARSIVNELQRRNPGAKVMVRDLGQSPPPHVGQAFITGMYAAPETSRSTCLERLDFLVEISSRMGASRIG